MRVEAYIDQHRWGEKKNNTWGRKRGQETETKREAYIGKLMIKERSRRYWKQANNIITRRITDDWIDWGIPDEHKHLDRKEMSKCVKT